MPSTSSSEVQPSILQYSFSPASNVYQDPAYTATPTPGLPSPRTSTVNSELDLNSPPHLLPAADQPINLSTMRELLQSREREIIDRVLYQLRSQNPTQPMTAGRDPQSVQPQAPNPRPPQPSSTLVRITELESQLARLQG